MAQPNFNNQFQAEIITASSKAYYANIIFFRRQGGKELVKQVCQIWLPKSQASFESCGEKNGILHVSDWFVAKANLDSLQINPETAAQLRNQTAVYFQPAQPKAEKIGGIRI